MIISNAFGDTRIGAQIITGIGFLGAGSVLHSHGFVLGLTTAATIWVVAGVGMALGSGMYAVAVFTTGMSLVTLYLLSFIEDKVQGRRSYSYSLVVTNLHQALASIHRVLQNNSVTAASFNFKKHADNYHVWFNLLIPRDTNLKIIRQLSEIPEITQVESGSAAAEAVAMPPGDDSGGGL
jgi:putative Mg2+ transporter-C (MgtC) family protein